MRKPIHEKNGEISTHILTRRMTCSKNTIQVILQHFNSHPHKEDDRTAAAGTESKQYFNSHPHKEDDEKKGGRNAMELISTHILTRRMTTGDWEGCWNAVFQLTSSQGG